MNKYLLDSNVFIDAKNRYYGFDIAPVFWDWLLSAHAGEKLYSIRAVHAELRDYEDELSMWVGDSVPAGFFLQPDLPFASSLSAISSWAAASQHFTETAKNEFLASADLQLVAYAHAHNMVAVSLEKSNPDRKKRIMVPDVCAEFSVTCVSPFEMLRSLKAKFS
ncbi:DUF4411 family protein [Pseudarthrobacter sp. MDT3-28]|uniref:DUF4411 family protein n=1 Tax=Pseudarthrobacter raffinosi TaxID=2953651 RepID=UPI00208FF925|nr:DUF4411 family protein [Pseudarthrobacter sp. MDT3-28]MCO4239485.1 DUF4411 family protein [Pseudarthrobacter sp. MDT3-28]